MDDDMDDNTRGVLMTIVLLVSILLSSAIGACHYHASILPLRMAEKNYCYVITDAGDSRGNGRTFAWHPCPLTPPLEKR